MRDIKKVVIPAAGLGTRFLPATKAIPKEMLPIVDTPTLQLIVAEAVAAGMEEVVIISGRGKASIEDHFDIAYELEDVLHKRGKRELARQMREIADMVELVSVRQKEPLGLGHAVLCAKDLIGDEPFAVMLGDDLIDAATPAIAQLAARAREHDKACIALMPVPEGQEQLYGIAAGRRLAERTWLIEKLVEKPPPGSAPSNLAVIGRYVLTPDIFNVLEHTRPGVGGEIQLTDGLAALARDGRLIGYEFEGERHDAGDRLGYLKANIAFALKREELREGLLAYMKEVVSRA
jgi:UTP--glucose-1-phosphate uridylyltransferase